MTFISFEGIDGCGKSTQLQMLAAHLEKLGTRVLATREPGGTALAESVRALILNAQEPLSSRAELLLFSAARAQHVDNVIRPALQRGEIVLCDRFIDSTDAYQGGGLGLDMNFVEQLNRFTSAGCFPDITFLLDCDANIGLARRLASRGNVSDRIEERGLAFQNRVRATFNQIAERDAQRVIRLDAALDADAIHQNILRVLAARDAL